MFHKLCGGNTSTYFITSIHNRPKHFIYTSINTSPNKCNNKNLLAITISFLLYNQLIIFICIITNIIF